MENKIPLRHRIKLETLTVEEAKILNFIMRNYLTKEFRVESDEFNLDYALKFIDYFKQDLINNWEDINKKVEEK